jgi:hypothetical protein
LSGGGSEKAAAYKAQKIFFFYQSKLNYQILKLCEFFRDIHFASQALFFSQIIR